MNTLNSHLPAWQALAAHAASLRDKHLRDLFATDCGRFTALHVESGPWLLDLSRQRITRETLTLLVRLGIDAGLPDRMAALFRGDPVNATEGRAALHPALRSGFAGGDAIQAEVRAS